MGLFSDLRKKKITAEMIQGATDAAKRLTPMVGDGRVTVTSVSGSGTAIGLRADVLARGTDKAVTISLSSPIAGEKGRYNAFIVYGPGDANADGNLGAADVGSTRGLEPDAIAWNEAEAGGDFSSHILRTGDDTGSALYEGNLVGKDDDGKFVVKFSAFTFGATDSPDTLPSGGAVEGSETADTTSWSRNTDNAPILLWMVSRVTYDTTSHKLYSFVRSLTIDSLGAIVAVSGETRVEVDAAVTCT
jgi:hypothetical protein